VLQNYTCITDCNYSFQGIAYTASQANFYFAHKYSSWGRGLNENTNGLILQYFPKKHGFTTITENDISMVMNKLNNQPRKCLALKTPNQLFFGINPKVALRT